MLNSFKFKFLLFGLFALSMTTQAAVPAKVRLLEKKGSQIGGVAGSGFTLLDLRHSQDSKRKLERIVLDVGDLNGANMKGLPGYFQVELKDNPQKLVINLAQMPHSKIDQQKLSRVLAKSLSIQKSVMALDPTDNTLTITLDLKQNTRARVLQVPGKKLTSKVVVDLISQ